MVYKHQVDKNLIPTCDIMGVHIAAINMDWLLDFTKKYIEKLGRVPGCHIWIAGWRFLRIAGFVQVGLSEIVSVAAVKGYENVLGI